MIGFGMQILFRNVIKFPASLLHLSALGCENLCKSVPLMVVFPKASSLDNHPHMSIPLYNFFSQHPLHFFENIAPMKYGINAKINLRKVASSCLGAKRKIV